MSESSSSPREAAASDGDALPDGRSELSERSFDSILRRTASYAYAADWERAEHLILASLDDIADEELPAFYIRAVALVHDLDPTPVLTPEPRTGPSARRVGRTGVRGDYAHAILTALRVRLTAKAPSPIRPAA